MGLQWRRGEWLVMGLRCVLFCNFFPGGAVFRGCGRSGLGLEWRSGLLGMSRSAAYGGGLLAAGLRCWRGKRADVSLGCILSCCFGTGGVLFLGYRKGRVLSGEQYAKSYIGWRHVVAGLLVVGLLWQRGSGREWRRATYFPVISGQTVRCFGLQAGRVRN